MTKFIPIMGQSFWTIDFGAMDDFIEDPQDCPVRKVVRDEDYNEEWLEWNTFATKARSITAAKELIEILKNK